MIPVRRIVDGIANSRELACSKLLTEWVLKLDPQVSKALSIAACGQHISRWTGQREEYPADQSGYLRRREDLKVFHAEKVGGILRDVG